MPGVPRQLVRRQCGYVSLRRGRWPLSLVVVAPRDSLPRPCLVPPSDI